MGLGDSEVKKKEKKIPHGPAEVPENTWVKRGKEKM